MTFHFTRVNIMIAVYYLVFPGSIFLSIGMMLCDLLFVGYIDSPTGAECGNAALFSVDVTHGHDYVAHVRFPPVPILWLLHILFVIAWA
jgi:hypothetical protein